ncbi:ASCH domain-containing protein [Mucilaginibacter sp.]
MKALTIRQPWAHLIVLGIKDIENRSWKTNYRGRIYVHAALNTAHGKEPIARYLCSYWKPLSPDFRRELAQTDFIKSAIIGEVDIIDCVQNHHSVWAEQEGWNWVLANSVKYEEPILKIKGGLSLWDLSLIDSI